MLRTACLALLLLASPLVLAHDPPAPILTCQGGVGALHEYLPAPPSVHVRTDGNADDCDGDGTRADADHEDDFGLNAALLVVGGPNLPYCLPGAVAHHGTTVRALDAAGFGPALTITADHARGLPVEVVDCGDGMLEPCPGAREPSSLPPPANHVEDAALALYDGLWVSAPCNPHDCVVHASGVAVGPTVVTMPCGPGADGTYEVFIEHDAPNARIPTGGHVWT